MVVFVSFKFGRLRPGKVQVFVLFKVDFSCISCSYICKANMFEFQTDTSTPHQFKEHKRESTRSITTTTMAASKQNTDYGTLSAGGSADAAIPQAEVSSREKGVMVVALFLKGGLLGAWIPFISLWLHAKNYSASGI